MKSFALNDHLFRKLCQDNDQQFQRLLVHTEVSWQSKKNCLRRLYDLYDTVVKVFKRTDDNLSVEFSHRHVDLAYLSDIFDKLNEVNLQLQGK